MNPKQALELAAYTFTATHSFDAVAVSSIYRGIENPTEADDPDTAGTPNRVHPSISIIADGDHNEVVIGTKIFRGPLVVRVETDGQSKTDAQFSAICEEVFAVFDITLLKEYLSDAIEDFRCLQANILDHGTAVHNGVNWQSEIVIDCVYGQSDL